MVIQMTGLKRIALSSTLAMIVITGGCTEDPFLQPTASTLSPLSDVKKPKKLVQSPLKSPPKKIQKEAIFILGGATERERFAAKFAQKHPRLPIWVSSGSPEDYTRKVFARAGITKSRVHLDYQAVDTVTNFTSLADEFQSQGINRVYLITSSDHMRRARVIGEIVFGSRGIQLKPVPVSNKRTPEPPEKCLRDGIRAILWVNANSTDSRLSQGDSMMSKSQPSYSQKLDECYK
jgi:uncharacterized SAM-binding protein YcdF (DUF218 family)